MARSFKRGQNPAHDWSMVPARLNNPVRRPKHGKAAPTTRQLDRRVKKIQNREEVMVIDRFVTANPTTGAQFVDFLCPIAQGDSYNQRDHNKVYATSVKFRYIVQNDVSDPVDHSQTIRIMVLWDKNPNGSLPTPYGTLQSVLDNRTITSPTLMPYNKDMYARFKIIYDKTHVCTPFVTTQQVIHYKRKKRLLGRQITFADANGNVASIDSNNVVLMILSDTSAFPPQCVLGSRLYFKDT